MSWGAVLGTVFFFLVSIAAISSSISMVEPLVKFLCERYNFSRFSITAVYCFAAWLFGLLTVFSFNIWESVDVLGTGKNPFGLIDFIASNILLPMGGFFIAIYTGWVLSKNIAKAQLSSLNTVLFKAWHWSVQFIAPVLIFIVLIAALLGDERVKEIIEKL